jgi:DNA-binding CsgD family transcriptional regulator
MGLSVDDHAAINRALENIYVLRDLDEFIVSAMRELPALVESDMAAYNEVNYAGRRMTTVIDSPVGQTHWHEVQIVFETIMNQNPLIEYSSRVRGGPKKISDFISDEQWRETGIYQAVYRNVSGEHQIAVALPVDEAAIVAFAFNRRHNDFTERDRSILAIMQPHLTQAYKNAQQHTQISTKLKRSEQALESIGAGWIDLDQDYRIVQATALARSNLDSFFRHQFADENRLPPDVEKWVTDNRSQFSLDRRVPPLVINAKLGRLIVRLLSVGQNGECSLLTERFLEDSSPKPLERLGLTARQAEVLYWICQGKSNAEIAVILKISVRTVTFHVSRILEILNAANRTEAANVATKHLTSGR